MPDPLQNPAFRPQGMLERLAGMFFGRQQAFDCIQIEISSHCLGACEYCPRSQKGWRQTHITPEIFSRLWPVLRTCKRAHLQGWGEPLLNPHFFELQQFAQKAGCQTSTTTCGYNLTPELAGRLAASGMDTLAVSLAGTDEASNSCRVNVPFSRVCEGLRNAAAAIKAQKSPMELHLAYLLLADRMESALALPELMREYDINAAVVSTLDYIFKPEQASLAILPHESGKLNRARAILEEIGAKAEEKGRKIYYDLPGEQSGEDLVCHENPYRCLYVNAAGEISPCIYLNVQGAEERRQVFGNVLETDPIEIWRDLDYKNFRNQLKWGHPGAECRNCPKRYVQESEAEDSAQ
ncbi:MAG: radical SAM protein [Desulfovibrio sp.]|nr:radical SAM protein [Desulfovibrio sp.]